MCFGCTGDQQAIRLYGIADTVADQDGSKKRDGMYVDEVHMDQKVLKTLQDRRQNSERYTYTSQPPAHTRTWSTSCLNTLPNNGRSLRGTPYLLHVTCCLRVSCC